MIRDYFLKTLTLLGIALSVFSGGSSLIAAHGTLMGMGDNIFGQLGDGTTDGSIWGGRETPEPVIELTGVAALGGGDEHSLAVKSDGTVVAWGSNSFGQLGNGTTANSPTPVQVLGTGGVGFLNVITGNPRPTASAGAFTTSDIDTHNGTLPAADVVNEPLNFTIVGQPSKGVATRPPRSMRVKSICVRICWPDGAPGNQGIIQWSNGDRSSSSQPSIDRSKPSSTIQNEVTSL